MEKEQGQTALREVPLETVRAQKEAAKQVLLKKLFLTLIFFNPAPCTLHPEPCTLNPAPYTLNPDP